jgi:hypothetical protein
LLLANCLLSKQLQPLRCAEGVHLTNIVIKFLCL